MDDTHAEARAVQIELLRQASPARRFAITSPLSRTVIELSRRALRRAMPNATDKEILLRWVELHFGADLAAAVSRDLARRGR